MAGLKFNTEKAYTGKVIAFIHDRGLKDLSDFAGIGAADVEAHLTDLAVDGDVALTTQNQAFYALLFLFEHVLKRDIGKINALRSTKAPRIPSVMSKALRLRVKDIDFDQMLIELHNSNCLNCSENNWDNCSTLGLKMAIAILFPLLRSG